MPDREGLATTPPSNHAGPDPRAGNAGAVRLITRYANRKLYDTQARQLTSLSRIEDLVRAGIDIRVVDHDTGTDMTAEVLVGILSASIGSQEGGDGVAALISLIRSPRELLDAMAHDRARAEELRGMTKRVRLLSATLNALLANMAPGPAAPEPSPPRRPRTRTTPP